MQNKTQITCTDLNRAAYDPSTVVDLQEILIELVLLFLVPMISLLLQVDGFRYSATEIHHSVSGVSPLQRLVAAVEPGHSRNATEMDTL